MNGLMDGWVYLSPNMYDLQSVLHFLRQVLNVLAVLCGKQHRLDACTKSSNEFLLDATNGSDTSAKGNFALNRIMPC